MHHGKLNRIQPISLRYGLRDSVLTMVGVVSEGL